ncbi:hypothetical protein D3C74_504270 [compost metagenome]
MGGKTGIKLDAQQVINPGLRQVFGFVTQTREAGRSLIRGKQFQRLWLKDHDDDG